MNTTHHTVAHRRGRAAITLAAALGAALASAPMADAAARGRGQQQRQANPQQSAPGRLGARAEETRFNWPIMPALVVVPDAAAYADAVARWTPAGRFPVLIDDGTDGARENIARFSREFKPEKILAWTGDPARSAAGVRERAEHAAAAAWGADSAGALRALWDSRKHIPPGAVITSADDPAWTAALALAAGRGLPFVWVERQRGRTGAIMKPEDFAAFDGAVRAGLDATGYKWKDLADQIDALTICLNMPTRLAPSDQQRAAITAQNNGQPKDPGEFALTDSLGRDADGRLWAWCGAIVGTESQAAYRAMCGLFLQPDRAWLFNGYPSTQPPFDAFQVGVAANALRRKGFDIVESADPPRGGLPDWKAKTQRGITANFVVVNTAGNKGWFDLSPERAYTSDIPALNLPALVYFTHSFSARELDDRDTIAARWFDAGAYAYVGSVDEPGLQTFTPPIYLAEGLATPIPLGVMARPNAGQAWKINLLGDPLLCIGKRPKRLAGVLPDLAGAEDVEQAMKDALGAGDFAGAARRLVVLGREDDASDLGKGIIADRLGSMTPDLARVLFFVYYRNGRADFLARVFDAMPGDVKGDTLTVDLAWQTLGPQLESTLDGLMVDVLKPHVRSATLVQDASALANAIQRLHGGSTAAQFVQRVIEQTKDPQQIKFLQSLRERVGR